MHLFVMCTYLCRHGYVHKVSFIPSAGLNKGTPNKLKGGWWQIYKETMCNATNKNTGLRPKLGTEAGTQVKLQTHAGRQQEKQIWEHTDPDVYIL